MKKSITVRIVVNGNPAPGGSKSGWCINSQKGKVCRGAIINMAPNSKYTKPWMALVKASARKAYQGPPIQGPISINATFMMDRPKSHRRSGKNAALLKANAPVYHLQKPDVTKLWRSTEDALTQAGVLMDDCHVSNAHIYKTWRNLISTMPGVSIEIRGWVTEREEQTR